VAPPLPSVEGGAAADGVFGLNLTEDHGDDVLSLFHGIGHGFQLIHEEDAGGESTSSSRRNDRWECLGVGRLGLVRYKRKKRKTALKNPSLSFVTQDLDVIKMDLGSDCVRVHANESTGTLIVAWSTTEVLAIVLRNEGDLPALLKELNLLRQAIQSVEGREDSAVGSR